MPTTEKINHGFLQECNKPLGLKIRGGHGAPMLGYNTLYAKGDFAGGVLRLYGSPHEEFDPAFPYGCVELNENGCVAFLGRADTFWVQVENTSGCGLNQPDLEIWVL